MCVLRSLITAVWWRGWAGNSPGLVPRCRVVIAGWDHTPIERHPTVMVGHPCSYRVDAAVAKGYMICVLCTEHSLVLPDGVH